MARDAPNCNGPRFAEKLIMRTDVGQGMQNRERAERSDRVRIECHKQQNRRGRPLSDIQCGPGRSAPSLPVLLCGCYHSRSVFVDSRKHKQNHPVLT